jgi:hypothetical protein
LKPTAVASSPGKLDEILAAGDPLLRHAGKVTGRVLHADDVGQLGKLPHRGGHHVDHRPGRDVVDDDRNADLVERAEMGDQALLRRLVVVGRDDQRGVGAHGLRVLDEAHGLDGVVGPRPRDHRNAARGGLHDDLDHLLMLVMGQRRAFPGRAHRHEAVRAFGDLPLHQRFQRVEIHGTVGKGRDERGHRTFEHRFGSFLDWRAKTGADPTPVAELPSS